MPSRACLFSAAENEAANTYHIASVLQSYLVIAAHAG